MSIELSVGSNIVTVDVGENTAEAARQKVLATAQADRAEDAAESAEAFATALLIQSMGYIGLDDTVPDGVDEGVGFVYIEDGRAFAALNTGGVADVQSEFLTQAALDLQLIEFATRSTATRTAMKALPITVTSAYLTEAGREGVFLLKTGTPPADAYEGIYVVSDTAGYYWQRQWDTMTARPEWFGVRGFADTGLAAEAAAAGIAVFANAATVDASTNRLRLQACLDMAPDTLLGPLFYYVDAPVYTNTSNHGLRGVRVGAEFYQAMTSGIVLTGANAGTADVVAMHKGTDWTVGPGGPLAGLNWPHGVRLSTFGMYRTAAAAGNATQANAGAGLRCAWSANVQQKDLFAYNHAIGFYYATTVYGKVDECQSVRDNAGSGANQFYYGFFQDGNYQLGSTWAGGNASLYFNRCKSGHLGGPSDSQGFVLTGFSDTWLDKFETYGSPNYGIHVIGNNGAASKSVRRVANVDLHIINPTLDGAGTNCMLIENLAAWASVEVTGIYSIISGSSSMTSIYVYQNSGGITFTDGEVLGQGNLEREGTGYGLIITDSPNVTVQGTRFVSCARPVYLLNAVGCRIEPTIYCPYDSDVATASVFAAVTLAGTTRNCRVSPVVTVPFDGGAPPGGYDAYANGVSIEATCSNNEVNWTMIDGANLGTRVRNNGTALTAIGAFGTNSILTGIPA